MNLQAQFAGKRYQRQSRQKVGAKVAHSRAEFEGIAMLGVFGPRDTCGRVTSGLILSVLVAAAIIAIAVHYITRSGSSSTLGGGANSFEIVHETREEVAQINKQREQIGEALRQKGAIGRAMAGNKVAEGAWENQVSRALRDCGDIAIGIEAFHRDVSKWPVEGADDEDVRVDYLYGNAGRMPRFAADARASWGDRAENLHSYLVSDGPEKKAWYDYFKHTFGRFKGWKGPYLPREEPDPWGRAYVVSVSGFAGGTKPGNHVWCLSAGPNGIVETPASSDQLLGDDVGKMME